MHGNMTDQELREAMKQMAKIAGLDLSQERIDQDLSSFKRHLKAIDAIHEVELDLEDEPILTFRLKKK